MSGAFPQMMQRRRITVVVAQIRLHCVKSLVAQRRAGGVIEIRHEVILIDGDGAFEYSIVLRL